MQPMLFQWKRMFFITLLIFSFQMLSAQNWALVSGISAQDIAVGKNGSVWAIGTNQAIYRWSGTAWETMPGGAVRIAVDPSGAAWVANAAGQVFKYNLVSKAWDIQNGSAKDIGIGADGSVWIIGTTVTPGGYLIYKWNGSGWTNIPGGAVRVAVDPSGNAWVVNSTNAVFLYNGSTFQVKPGSVKDVGVGANGSTWCTGNDGKIYQWDGSTWKMQTGGASQVSVAPDGNAWVVNDGGAVYRSTNAVLANVQIRTIFQRNQTYEYQMLQALRMQPYFGEVVLAGPKLYANVDPLGQAFGSLGLLAAEIYYYNNTAILPNQALSQIASYNDETARKSVLGILAVLVMDRISRNLTDQPNIALKKWATDIYYGIKVRSAKAVLDEYQKWATDPCTYTADGYKPPVDCGLGSMNFTQWYGTHSAPQDILVKAGLKSVLANNADAMISGIAVGLTAVTIGASAAALTSGLGVLVGSTIVNTSATTITLGFTSLCGAFGGTTGSAAGAAGAAIGATSWAGVVAAPVAAAILAIVVGTVEGFRVVEQAKVEPMLKMKLGAAMTDPIEMANMMADTSAKQMFFIAFQESARKGFQITPPNVNGEVRFYCQAGYVSSFKLSYTLNGQAQSFTTADLAVGTEQSFPIPYNATNIRAQGWYSLGGWKELFNQTLAKPTFICYTSYGTIIQPSFKTDCPEVGSMTTQARQLTVTQGGGYIAHIKLTYTQNGQTVNKLDNSSLSAGWRQVYDIPADATNIRLQAWSATGLAWEPWKSIVDKTWPSPPNECIKVYGTTLDPKWNNECK